MTRSKVRFVWCAEDEKYGLLAVFATKKSAERDYGFKADKWRWIGGQGGTIIKRKVYE
jgi:hypothetical protein